MSTFGVAAKRVLGNTGMQVGPVGLGGAELGFQVSDDKIVDALIGTALDTGINVIDTAAMYSDSEKKIGKALTGRRGKVLLFTKCGLSLPSQRRPIGILLRSDRKLRKVVGLPDQYESLDWHPRALEWNINQSLRRLKTDYLDLIQLHSCSEETLRNDKVVEVLQKARAAGKVRYIGYSSDGKATNYAIQSGLFQTIQIAVNIADQKPIDHTLPNASRRGLGVIVKRPLANCLWKNNERPSFIHFQAYWDRLRKLNYDFLSDEHGVEVALRFVLTVLGVHTVLVGTTNPSHLKRSAECATACLENSEFEMIRARWKEVASSNWDEQV